MDTFHKHHPSQKRYTIGVLASTLLNENGRELWYGLVDLPKERGFNTIYFAGGWLNDPNDFDSQSNIVYDLIDEKKVDGLIIWTSALGRFVSNDEVQQFCERYRPLPIVSLGAPLAGIPSVLIDSYQAMSDMLTHLIEVHNCRQIAFIRGPSGHFDTEERVRAYKDVLAKYRIDFNPRLLSAPCPWHNTHSRDAIRLMLDEYKVFFDAVACSSDSFVEGVHGELSSRGYRIPEDVALVGFDNKPTCQTMEPPLTTIPIMMYDRVQIAANMLLQMLNGEPVPEQVFVSCPLIIRRSCGCNPSVSRSNHLRKPLKLPSKIVSADRIIKRYRRQIMEELNQVFNPSDIFSDQNWNEQLLDNLITDLGDASSASFLAAFQKIFERKEIEYLNIA
ncbi:MAG: substrate-binding domain-containing protein, partial [Firmicutes bacterium]|nr:substrate-binding domain-containing protein [Bacillota bacterium]